MSIMIKQPAEKASIVFDLVLCVCEYDDEAASIVFETQVIH